MDRTQFWSKVDRTGECWPWMAARMWQGYGAVRIDGKTVRAHRIAWELVNGPIPDGLFVLHSCDNRPCVRPEHLRLGNAAENMRDAATRGRMPTGDRHWSRRHPELAAAAVRTFHYGSDHQASRLTETEIIAIRQARDAGRSGRSLAHEYGVSDSYISDVIRRKTWAWLK